MNLSSQHSTRLIPRDRRCRQYDLYQRRGADEHRKNFQFTSEDESALIQAVKFGPEEKIREVTARIIGRMSDAKVHARQYQTYILSVANCLVQLIQQYDLEMDELLLTQRWGGSVYDHPPGHEPGDVLKMAPRGSVKDQRRDE